MRDVSGKLGVDQVRLRLITDARQAIPDKLDRNGSGQLQPEGDAIEKGEGSTKGKTLPLSRLRR